MLELLSLVFSERPIPFVRSEPRLCAHLALLLSELRNGGLEGRNLLVQRAAGLSRSLADMGWRQSRLHSFVGAQGHPFPSKRRGGQGAWGGGWNRLEP